jgi:tetratricopeptide (TPR) repeat protein
MIDNDNVAAAATQLDSAFGRGSFDSLGELRDAHDSLRRGTTVSSEEPSQSSLRDRIRSFLSQAPHTGAFLNDPRERRAAQSILDYWSAELASLSDAKSDDFGPVLLDDFDPATTGHDRNASSHQADKSDQRALIRFSAFAREWKASGEHPGYLLTGDAIAQATRFAGIDRGLDEFIEASAQAEERRARKARAWLIVWATAATACVLCFAAFAAWKFWYLEKTKEKYISQLKSGDADQTEALKWLDGYQAWLSPYDLSGTLPLEGITLPGLRLYAPNFADVSFRKVSWPGAQLAGASFTQSQFSFADGKQPNDLRRANLRQAQFRSARIAFTSFSGADLYRAVFDRAMLCNVDFSGANLRSASFWAVTLDSETERTLRNTNWWQAVGWPWSEIQEIIQTEPQMPLKESEGFAADIQRGLNALQNAASGTPERALALNDIAWTRAVWGIDVSDGTAPASAQAASSSRGSDTCGGGSVPADGRRAAEEAVCIATKLNADGGSYAELLATLQDTLAYLLMQSGEMSEALKTFEEIRKSKPTFFDNGEILFRYAIAQYAADQDQLGAIENFKDAIEKKRYQPTHELQTLKNHIFNVQEFVTPLKASIDKQWPPVPNPLSCPRSKAAAVQ